VRTEYRTSVLVVVRDSEVRESCQQSGEWSQGATHTAVVIFLVFVICEFYNLFAL